VEAESLVTRISEELGELSDRYEELVEEYSWAEEEKTSLEEDYLELVEEYGVLEEEYSLLLEDYEELLPLNPVTPQKSVESMFDREYTWMYGGEQYTLSLSIPESDYNYYQDLARPIEIDYTVYVSHPYDDAFIDLIVEEFNEVSTLEGFSMSEKVDLAISFVQSLPYKFDDESTGFDEYPRYPLETLVDNGGDCEDTSILTASLLDSLGYDVVLLGLPGHIAVGVNTDTFGSYYEYDGVQYFYLETTATGWSIGEIPEEYSEEYVDIYTLDPVALCVHTWNAVWQEGDQIDVTVNVENLGSASASGYRVYVAFEAEGDYVWNPVESTEFYLEIEDNIDIIITVDVPEDEYTRIIVHILDSEGYAVDTSYSEWFTT
jgi:hypothetical protein